MTSPTPFFSLTDLGLTASPTLLLQQWLTTMQGIFIGYEPSQGNLEFIMAQIFASQAADLAQLCSNGADSLFQTFGTELINLPLQVGSPAVATLQVSAVNTAGYTLPAGTQFTLNLAGALTAFQTSTDAVIPTGQSSVQVTVASVQPGSAFNGAGSPASLVSQVTWVSAITVVTGSADGEDPEDSSHYLTRLTNTLQLMAPRPITASDYATLALNFTPQPGTDQQEVGRATSIDGYDPGPTPGPLDAWSSQAGGTNTFNNEREVTTCITDNDGDALTLDTAIAVQEWFESLRELNFIINVVAPNYSPVYVSVTVQALAGYTAATVQSNVQSAIFGFLSPATFGLPPLTTVGWSNTTVVRQSRLETAIQNAVGVDFVVDGSLAFDLISPPVNIADLTLPGPFPLPQATSATVPLSNITVNVVA